MNVANKRKLSWSQRSAPLLDTMQDLDLVLIFASFCFLSTNHASDPFSFSTIKGVITDQRLAKLTHKCVGGGLHAVSTGDGWHESPIASRFVGF